MHILFISNNFPKPEQPGVPRPWQMARHWVKNGNKVTVIVNVRHYMEVENIHSKQENKQLVRRHYEAGIEIVEVMTSWGRRRSMVHRILNYVTYMLMCVIVGMRIRSVDLVYVRTPPILSYVGGYLLSLLKKTGFVLEIGDLHPDESVALGLVKNPLIVRAWEAWENFFRGKADLIVAVVPGIKSLLAAKGFSDEKIVIATNAYDPPKDSRFCIDDMPRIKTLLNDKGRFYVVYAGSMGKAISLQCTIEAAALIRKRKLRDIVFVYIGDGDNRQKLKEQCRKEKIDNCVFVDPVSSSQIPFVLSRMDVLFHSVYRGDFHGYNLPNKIFTYLGAARPIIFAGTGDIAEIVKKARCGIVVPPENPEAFANAVEKLYGSADSLDKIGERGLAYVKKHFNREAILQKLNEHISRII